MEKVNIFSVFLFNPFRRLSKKYLLFIFLTMAILLCYGFFFTTKVYAEENVVVPTEVLEIPEVPEVPATITTEEVVTPTEVPEVSATITTEEAVIPTEVFNNIESDITWKQDGSPYLVTNSILVKKGATLTIEAGTIVKFDSGTAIIVKGSLDAEGTAEEPIYFTSAKDDTLGGDTNNDGGATTPSKGDWDVVNIIPENDPPLDDSELTSSTLNYITSKYSNRGFLIFDKEVSSEGLYVDSQIALYNSNSTFNKLVSNKIDLFETSVVTIDGSTLNSADGSVAVRVSDASKLDISNSSINGCQDCGSTVLVFGGSTLTLDSVQVNIEDKDGYTFGIGIFNEGTNLIMKRSTETGAYTGMIIGTDAKVIVEDSIFECTNSCIEGNGGSLSITKSKISGASKFGVTTYDKPKTSYKCTYIYDENGDNVDYICEDVILEGSLFELNNNEIFGNGVGVNSYGGKIIGKNNNIHNNIIGASNISKEQGGSIVDLKNNFWGDKTGPKNLTTNPTGLGNEVANNVLFTPWLKFDPTKERKDPIIIVPGIMGTELIRDYGDKDEIWPAVSKVIFSIFDNYLKELSLTPDGKEDSNFPIIKGDIIRDIPTSDIFNGLVSELENNGGYKEGENLFVFPYDWRFSNTKNAELLKEKIDQVLADTEKDKVDIVAHSMGGLLTKEYIKENGKDKIDHLIFLGTPHLGAPKAYKALVYGDSMGFEKFYIPFLSSNIVKFISQNMPSIYELLPSRKYVDDLRYISEKTIGSDPAYLDYDATKNLLLEKKINQPMLESADTFHQGIDEIDLSDIKVANISACGEATISAINIRKEVSIGPIKLKEDYKLKYANGDSTVPLDSSYGIANVNKYFVDKVSHSALPSAPDIPEAVLNILEDKDPQAGTKVFKDVRKCTPINGYILGMHSPISLDIYDAKGNHSGLDLDGNIESNIEGVSYDTIGEAKFAFIPDGLNVNVKGSATGSGTFDLSIEKVIGGETTETKFWNDVPITSISKISFDFNSYTNTNTIELDNNGNKKNIPISNVLSQGEDYLAVPTKIIEERKQGSSGSYIKNNSKFATNIPSIVIKPEILPDIKKFNLEKQPIIKKPLAKVIEKKVVIIEETIIPTSNLGASVINAGQDIDFWGTIRSFFRRLFHIKK